MKICKKGQAGTVQSSDLMVTVEPADALIIEIESTVKKQFEHLIRAKLEQVLAKHGTVSVPSKTRVGIGVTSTSCWAGVLP